MSYLFSWYQISSIISKYLFLNRFCVVIHFLITRSFEDSQSLRVAQSLQKRVQTVSKLEPQIIDLCQMPISVSPDDNYNGKASLVGFASINLSSVSNSKKLIGFFVDCIICL